MHNCVLPSASSQPLSCEEQQVRIERDEQSSNVIALTEEQWKSIVYRFTYPVNGHRYDFRLRRNGTDFTECVHNESGLEYYHTNLSICGGNGENVRTELNILQMKGINAFEVIEITCGYLIDNINWCDCSNELGFVASVSDEGKLFAVV